jgi:endonuclease/exonuclease/phosphatase family metal-dependent hydrolase
MHLRVLSYNIHKAIGGLDRRYRPDRVRDVLQHHAPDIVLLQEVDSGAQRSHADAQVNLLGDALGLDHRAWFPNVRVHGGGHYGNAVLSRFPLVRAENIDLTIGRRKPRSVLHAQLRARFGGRSRTIHVFTLHLGLSGRERHRQLARFLECQPFERLHRRTPIVIAGDFNDVYGSLGKRHFAPVGFRTTQERIRTFPAYAPLRALDAIYVRGDLALQHVQPSRLRVAKHASDHLPLIADVELR